VRATSAAVSAGNRSEFAVHSWAKPCNFFDTYILLYSAQCERAPFYVNLSGRVPLTPNARARDCATPVRRGSTPSSRANARPLLAALALASSSRARVRDASSRAMANAGELLARADALLKKYVGAARLDAMRRDATRD
jgi:hypothetical protein